ncbi:microtubule-associated tyrosine carboxypeptidase 1 isoform X2 [Aotus nancymaae]|uniref:microtubule-associated tyrosine carboxypeptidase 1 isoform X2 n=1 Tax=Aotus nancymaae TaxID=37293 RepID=UPI0030FE461B
MKEVDSVGSWSDPAGCDPQDRMVLDSGAQAYEQAPHSPPTSPSSLRHRLKPSDRDGPPLYPWSQSLALPLALAVPPALQPQPEQQPFSQPHLGRRGHMRRSESTHTVNSTGWRGRGILGRPPLGRERNPGGGTLRPAASLPHIAKTQRDAGHGASKSPCMLVALRPTNMDRERDKFFQSHYTYNPQFEYQEPVPTAVLEKYCEASGQFIHQAVGIIEAVLEKFGTYEHFEAATGGQLLTKCQIWSIVRKYMQKEGCVGEVVVQLSEDLLSQAVMMVENSRPTLAINLTGARQYWLEGMLRHEIATSSLWLAEVGQNMPAHALGSPSSLAPFGYIFLSPSSPTCLGSGGKADEALTGQRENPQGPIRLATTRALQGGRPDPGNGLGLRTHGAWFRRGQARLGRRAQGTNHYSYLSVPLPRQSCCSGQEVFFIWGISVTVQNDMGTQDVGQGGICILVLRRAGGNVISGEFVHVRRCVCVG